MILKGYSDNTLAKRRKTTKGQATILISLNINKTMAYDVGNLDPGLRHAQNVAEFNLLFLY
jgi:hypothetical protein